VNSFSVFSTLIYQLFTSFSDNLMSMN